MSSRARRVAGGAAVCRFDWHTSSAVAAEPALYIVGEHASVPEPAAAPATPALDVDAHLASLEREAFAKGYAAGERAGVEAGGRRADAMLRRVAETLESLSQLRRTIIQQTEHQVVELALTLARRVVAHEVSLDPQFVAALAHVALERLGEQAPATIRLHPDDYANVTAQRGEAWEGGQVSIVPDAGVPKGGCQVESDFGLIDAGVDAQFDELSRALLGDGTGAAARVTTHGR